MPPQITLLLRRPPLTLRPPTPLEHLHARKLRIALQSKPHPLARNFFRNTFTRANRLPLTLEQVITQRSQIEAMPIQQQGLKGKWDQSIYLAVAETPKDANGPPQNEHELRKRKWKLPTFDITSTMERNAQNEEIKAMEKVEVVEEKEPVIYKKKGRSSYNRKQLQEERERQAIEDEQERQRLVQVRIEEERIRAEELASGKKANPDEEPETFQECTARIIEHYCGKDTVDTWILGRKPVGVVEEAADDPRFYMKAQIFAGTPIPPKNIEHAWFSKADLQKYLADKEYHKIRPLLSLQ